MRVMTKQLWRAFPELDSFDDERCARFVAAAQRGRRAALLRLSAAGVAFVASAALLVTLSQIMLALLGVLSRPGDLPIGAIGIGVMVILTLAGAAAMLVRDVMLRRRVLWVIKAKGTCAGCGYGLLGLPVPDDLRVTCPECGLEMWVDAAMAELVTDERGQRRLKPKPEKRVLPRWMNRRLAWNLGKVAAMLVLLAVVGAAGWWAWREHQLVEQAKVARGDLHGLEVIQEMNSSQYPPVPPDESESEARAKDGWTLFDKVFGALDVATNEVTSSPDAIVDAQGAVVPPETTAIFQPPLSESATESERDQHDAQREMARRLIRRFEAIGGDAQLQAMTDAKRAVRDWSMIEQPNQPPATLAVDWLGPTRRVARVLAAKMELAVSVGDRDSYIVSLEAGLKLAAMLDREPLLMNRLVGNVIRTLVLEQLRRHVVRGSHDGKRMPSDWIGPIDDAIARRAEMMPLDFVFDGEREVGRQTIAWLFSDPARVRSVAAVNAALGGGFFAAPTSSMAARVGTYRENLEALDAVYANAKIRALAPINARVGPLAGVDPSLIIAASTAPTLGYVVVGDGAGRNQLLGIKTILAIERFRVEEGHYPKSLEELVPTRLEHVPIDQLTLSTFRYRQVDPLTDELGRGYLLYSIGYDGVDNDGKTTEGGSVQEITWGPNWAGFDYVFNAPR